jgi:hypothetical protein
MNPVDEKKAQKSVKKLIDYSDLFASEVGQRVLYDLCKRFHYFQTSYNGNVNDTLFKEGERNVINFILFNLQQNPEKILNSFRDMMKKEMEDEYGC